MRVGKNGYGFALKLKSRSWRRRKRLVNLGGDGSPDGGCSDRNGFSAAALNNVSMEECLSVASSSLTSILSRRGSKKVNGEVNPKNTGATGLDRTLELTIGEFGIE